MQSRVAKEYKGHSCHQWHKQKIKCTRERPCRNCALMSKHCTYAVRGRRVVVAESYLRKLEGSRAGQDSPVAVEHRPLPEAHISSQPTSQRGSFHDARPSPKHSVENSTAQVFVSKLKQIQVSNAPPGGTSFRLESTSLDNIASEIGSVQTYDYFALNTDQPQTTCTFKLPPYPYAIFLLDQFALYLGQDWHWFRLQKFRLRLQSTYMTANSAESNDRIWLCQLLVVLALAESINACRQPQIFLDLNDRNSASLEQRSELETTAAPGSEFFEQALRLLNIPFESASIEHVEVLNMIALYNNQLNRQKTAYMYAGQSARLCNMLELHLESSSRDCLPVEREHRKRVWWSTYILDRMTSTSTGYLPTLQIEQTDLEYPSKVELPPGDAEEFADADYLNARVHLTVIMTKHSEDMAKVSSDGKHDMETVIRPMLHRLHSWKSGLPPHMATDLEDGLFGSTRSLQCARSLASFHLRLNQSIILLIRPLILKQIAGIFSEPNSYKSQASQEELNNTCLACARTSLLILLELRSRGLLVRLGLMENMHLFTSLMILRLAVSINARRPGSFDQRLKDNHTYDAGKELLVYMMQSGSMAAKGHLNMLKEVEELAGVIASQGETETTDEGEQWNVEGLDEWMTQLLESGNVANGFEW